MIKMNSFRNGWVRRDNTRVVPLHEEISYMTNTALCTATAMMRRVSPQRPVRLHSAREPNGVPLINHKGAPFVSWSDIERELSQRIAGNSAINAGSADQAANIFQIFLDAGISGISAGNVGSGVCDILWFCLEVAADPNVLNRTVISIGYGGAEEPGGLRLPAYAVPGAEILKGFSELGLPLPLLRIFSGQMAGVDVNGFNTDKVWGSTLRNFAITGSFLQKFYKGIIRRVVFDFDRPAGGSKTLAMFTELARQMKKRGASEIFEQMAQQSAKHSDQCNQEEAFLKYAGYHPAIFGDCFTEETFTPYLETLMERGEAETSFFLSIGGPPERFFNPFRRFIADGAKKALGRTTVVRHPRLSLPMLTEVGKVPVYYPTEREPRFSPKLLREILDDPGRASVAWSELTSDPRLTGDFGALTSRIRPLDYFNWASKMAENFALAEVVSGEKGVELFAGYVISTSLRNDLISYDETPNHDGLSSLCTMKEPVVERLASDARGHLLAHGANLS